LFSCISSLPLLLFLRLLPYRSNFHYRITKVEGLVYFMILFFVFLRVFCGLKTLFIMPVIFSRESETETANIV
jgi:hypothetical protein